MRGIIFYDGCCALCNRFVKFVLRKDEKGLFSFASLQSEYASKHVPKAYLENTDSVVLQKDREFHIKSKAAFSILRELRTGWKILTVFSFLPVRVTDLIYDLVATSRYRIFGRYNACPAPPQKYKKRFLDLTSAK